MRRNTAGQFVGCQLIAKADGTPVTTGTTTVSVTGDAGTQATGSVGAGACTHEGNGYWTYAPAQAETNYTQVAFTFVNTSAINVTVQLYPIAYDASGQMTGVVLGATQTGVTIPTVTTVTGLTAATVHADLDDIQARLPAALTANGNMKSSLVEILTTALTETAGLLAGGFKKFFNIASPVSTMDVLARVTLTDTLTTYTGNTPQTGDVFPLASTEIADIKAKTDLIPAAPAAVGDIPTANAIADQVWDEILSGHAVVGSTGAALSAAGGSGDPWATALPGAYGAGTAGKIVGDNVNATISSRASQASVDDVPTNAELATALGTADDATLAAIAALNNLSQANIRTAVGLASANLDTQLADLPTNAELATSQATADDATLAAIAALTIPTAIENADALLNRDMATGTDSGSTTVRTVRQALRFLRNKWSISGTTLTVTKEDDTTSSWTSTLGTTPGVDPVTSSDPAGP